MIFVQIMHDSTRSYRGRFAPSPTGLLHFGSLVAAVGSYLEARWNRGRWLVRMEDLDRPREARGASKAILRMLEAYGFEWDGKVVFQSRRDAAYGAALKRLEHGHAVFPCACTRREISDSTVSAAGEPIYPGTCRKGPPPGRTARAMRVRVDNAVIAFEDLLQGRIEQNLGREVGDFIVRRATASLPTSSPWWWMISSRTSPMSCAAPICSPRRHGRSCCSACSVTRRRDTCIFRSP